MLVKAPILPTPAKHRRLLRGAWSRHGRGHRSGHQSSPRGPRRPGTAPPRCWSRPSRRALRRQHERLNPLLQSELVPAQYEIRVWKEQESEICIELSLLDMRRLKDIMKLALWHRVGGRRAKRTTERMWGGRSATLSWCSWPVSRPYWPATADRMTWGWDESPVDCPPRTTA